MTKTKWIIYTVLLGLTPMIGRFLIYLISTGPAPIVSAGDIIAFGLVLVITNINLLEHEENVPTAWKTRSIGLSLVMAVLLAILFAAMCFQEVQVNIVDLMMIKVVASILSVSCLLFSYSVIDRLSAIKAS